MTVDKEKIKAELGIKDATPTPAVAASSPKEIEMEMTPEEAVERRRQRKAQLAQVLNRGVLSDKLKSILDAAVPEGRGGKFVLDHDEHRIRYTNLGFNYEYRKDVPKHLLHADGHIRVGDVVLMTIDLEDAAILREIQIDGVKKRLVTAKHEFVEQAAKDAQEGGAQPFNQSQVFIDTAVIDRR